MAVGLGCLAAACPAWACSGVGPAGAPVVFGGQTNIIIWDADRQVEHFIRNASFRSGAEDFGFIAPTPGKPELHEASTLPFTRWPASPHPFQAAGLEAEPVEGLS